MELWETVDDWSPVDVVIIRDALIRVGGQHDALAALQRIEAALLGGKG